MLGGWGVGVSVRSLIAYRTPFNFTHDVHSHPRADISLLSNKSAANGTLPLERMEGWISHPDQAKPAMIKVVAQIQPEPTEAISPAIARPAMLMWTDIPRSVRTCAALMFSSFMRVASCPINFKHSQGDKLLPSTKLKTSDEVVNVGMVPSVRCDVLPMVWDLSITNEGALIMLGCKAAMMFSMLRSLIDLGPSAPCPSITCKYLMARWTPAMNGKALAHGVSGSGWGALAFERDSTNFFPLPYLSA